MRDQDRDDVVGRDRDPGGQLTLRGRVGKWDEELSGVVGSLAAPDDFLKNKLAPENSDLCSFSFAKFLSDGHQEFAQFVFCGQGVQISRPQRAAAQIEIAKERFQVCANRLN
jgi:hypothetical protein